jgi:Domain of unknown function (DUF5666)
MKVRPRRILSNSLTAFAVSCLLALCIAGRSEGGIEGSGLRRVAVYGRITAVGPIAVNGTVYSASDARVSVDGSPGYPGELRVGQVIELRGEANADSRTGIADEISFTGNVRGAITTINPEGPTFTVLQQTVRLTGETLIDGIASTDVATLQVATNVEVSGFANAQGEIVASRIDRVDSQPAAQVRGELAALDEQAHTFLINGLLIDYGAAVVDGTLRDHATVLVRGALSTPGGALVAKRVTVTGPLGAPNEKGDLEGLITSYTSAAEFELAGQRIVGDERTNYILHGAALGPNVHVEVSGRFQANGVLLADKVQVKSAQSARAKGKPRRSG